MKYIEQTFKNKDDQRQARRMLRRWIYLIPYERKQELISPQGRSYHGGGRTGILLWDPLLEYTEAMGENGDNVENLVKKLKENAADPLKRTDIIIVSNNTIPIELTFTKTNLEKEHVAEGVTKVKEST